MRRRELVTLVGAAAVWPLAARAQQAERMRRIGMLMSIREDDVEGQARLALLRQGLKDLGWIEERNIKVDYRWAGGDAARAKTDAAKLVSQKPDLIIANSTMSLTAVRDETSTIPIVFLVVGDPIGQGFVSSYRGGSDANVSRQMLGDIRRGSAFSHADAGTDRAATFEHAFPFECLQIPVPGSRIVCYKRVTFVVISNQVSKLAHECAGRSAIA